MIRWNEAAIKDIKKRRKIIVTAIEQRLLKQAGFRAYVQLAKKYPKIRGHFNSNTIKLTNKVDKKFQKEFEKLVNEKFLRLLDLMMTFILGNINRARI